MLKFTEDHEWLKIEGDTATVGITDHAQEQLGDLVFVELPETGAVMEKGDTAATIESVKAASEVYAPVSGEITAINDALTDAPETVNGDAMGEGWFFRIKLSDKGELDAMMDEAAYKKTIE